MNNKKKQQQQPRGSTQHQPARPISGSRPTSVAKGSLNNQNEDEIYNNPRFMHACASIVGTVVTVETVAGEVYEGIFQAFSPKLELSLELAHLVDPKEPGKILEDQVLSKFVIQIKDIVRCSAIDTDLSYATKDGFLTDAQISAGKSNGEVPMKELEEWEPEGVEDSDLHDLNSDNANGWRPEEMFAINERKYFVQSTYKPTLEGYTVPLAVEDSKEFREKEAYAAELAREIEGSGTNRTAIELEDGDEEEAFSAVVRPQRGSERNSVEHDQSDKYIPPARRQNSNPSANTSRMDNNRQSGPRHHNAPTHHTQNQGAQTPNRDNQHQRGRNERDYQTSPSMSPHANSSSSHSVRDHHVHHRGGCGRSGGGGGVQNNGPRRTNNYNRDSRNDHEASPQQQQQQRGHMSNRGGHLGPGGPAMRSQQLSDLKEFGTKFQLAPSPSSVSPDQTSPKPQPHPMPQHGEGKGGASGVRVRSPPMHDKSASPGEQRQTSPPPGQQQHLQTQQQQLPQEVPSPAASHGIQRQTSETEGSVNQNMSPASNESASSTPTTTSTASTVKKSNLNPNAKEFVFNPNAGVFVPGGAGSVNMSPGGTPSMSNTPPQRPMTPATPTMTLAYPQHLVPAGTPGVQQQIMYMSPASIPGPVFTGGQQNSPYAFQQSPSTGPLQQPQQQQHQMNQQRYRGNMNSNQGPRGPGGHPLDVNSQNVMAASGPPLLSAPLNTGSPSQPPSFMPHYPPQPHQQQQFNAAMAANMALMQNQVNQGMIMRIPPGAPMNHMIVAPSPTTPPMPITTMSGVMDQMAAVAWMQQQQSQGPMPHMPGVPPPTPNSMAVPHLGQPPPQQQHNPNANSQAAAVQAAVAQQQQQQQVGSNGGGHTPAPSPGPMGPMYNATGPQSLPHQFQPGYPGGVFMMQHGHPMQQTLIQQGQGVPQQHPHMHQYTMQQHQVVPGQQNAPHMMLSHQQMAQVGQPTGPPAVVQTPQWGDDYFVGEESQHYYNHNNFYPRQPKEQVFYHYHHHPLQTYNPPPMIVNNDEVVQCITVPKTNDHPSPSKLRLGGGNTFKSHKNTTWKPRKPSVGEKGTNNSNPYNNNNNIPYNGNANKRNTENSNKHQVKATATPFRPKLYQ